MLRRLGEVDGERHAHAIDGGMAAIVLLREHADEAGLEPLRLLRPHARPAEAAQSLHLALLDRERNLARAGIAADDAELGADRVVEARLKIDGQKGEAPNRARSRALSEDAELPSPS
jgi:hypothetical protein